MPIFTNLNHRGCYRRDPGSSYDGLWAMFSMIVTILAQSDVLMKVTRHYTVRIAFLL